MADELSALEADLVRYVSLRRQFGEQDYLLGDALIAHRRQCMANYLDEEDPMWAERVKLLDRLAGNHGIPLSEERPLRYAVEEIAERERQRRAEIVERMRAQREAAS